MNQTHQRAVAIVEFYLKVKGRDILADNFFKYPTTFVNKHKLDKRFQGHSFDILTGREIFEIDDYSKHSKKNQKINDGIVTDFVQNHLIPFGFEFYRLQKEEIVDEKGHLQPTAAEYLKENLF